MNSMINFLQQSMKRLYKKEETPSQVFPTTSYTEVNQALTIMTETHSTNLEALETYLDIFKKKKKNINSVFIKSIYKMFSENRANQIFYEKQVKSMKEEKNERILQRYYARVIEMGIKKVSFFLMNSQSLGFLSPCLEQFMRELTSCYNNISKRKNYKSHFKMLRLLFKENSYIEDKIYQELIYDGYLSSMDEFYRINGIGLIGDQMYNRKEGETEGDTLASDKALKEREDMDSLINQILMENLRKRERSKRMGRFLPSHDTQPVTMTQTQIDKKLSDIKSQMSNLISNMKEGLKEQEENLKKDEIPEIIESNREYLSDSGSEQEEPKGNSEDKAAGKLEKKRQILSRMNSQTIQRTYSMRKRDSIELLSYFSSDFKSVISSNTPGNELSELLLGAEPHQKNSRQRSSENKGKISSAELSTRIKNQKNRGKLLDIANQRRLSKEIDAFYNEITESGFESEKNSYSRPKISFKSAPGVYFYFNTGGADQNPSQENNNQKKLPPQKANNKFRIKPHHQFESDIIFENEAILNELISHKPELAQKSSMLTSSSKMSAQPNMMGVLALGYDSESINQKLRVKDTVKANGGNNNYKKIITEPHNGSRKENVRRGLSAERDLRTMYAENLERFKERKSKDNGELHKQGVGSNGFGCYAVYDRNRKCLIDAR